MWREPESEKPKAQAHEKKWRRREKKNDEKKNDEKKIPVYLYVWYTFNVIRLYCAYILYICHMAYADTFTLFAYFCLLTHCSHPQEYQQNTEHFVSNTDIRHFVRKKQNCIHSKLSCQSVVCQNDAFSLHAIVVLILKRIPSYLCLMTVILVTFFCSTVALSFIFRIHARMIMPRKYCCAFANRASN